MNIFIVSILLFVISFFMNMVGKGGGNFYVLILTLFGFSIYQSATIGQFILFFSSLSAVIVFYKNKKILWDIVLIIAFSLFISSFAGGYFSHIFSERILKLFFSLLLFLSGIIIMIPKKSNKHNLNRKRKKMNMLILSLIVIFIGFFSGMLGVSGGSFLVPLIYFLFNISMQSAIATSSVLISLSALTGFTGHVIQGDFNIIFAVFFAFITILGGVLGSKISLISKQYSLKYIFAISNFIASVLMILKIYNII